MAAIFLDRLQPITLANGYFVPVLQVSFTIHELEPVCCNTVVTAIACRCFSVSSMVKTAILNIKDISQPLDGHGKFARDEGFFLKSQPF
ncbi:hypothetical protein [Chlorogloeopsis sp. ULAP02]|uniref:hypothetical protein n=1 Tax=Chlorogloeopsis sp. ULAP02 TaxID=3107926 RepID=UPI0031366132